MFILAIVRPQVFHPVIFSFRLESGTELSKVGYLSTAALGSPVVGLPPFSLWTAMFCSISSADGVTHTAVIRSPDLH